MREYERRGKFEKYCGLKTSFAEKFEVEVTKYKDKITEDVRTGNRSCAYSALRKLDVHGQGIILATLSLYCLIVKTTCQPGILLN